MAMSIVALIAAAGCTSRPLPRGVAGATPDGSTSSETGGDEAPDGGPPSTWAEMAPPGLPASGATLTDMWAAGDDDLFVTAYLECRPGDAQCSARTPLVFRWRREAGWTTEQGLPARGWTPESIDGTSADDVWAVGGDAIYHRDPGGWSLVDPSWQAVTAGGSNQPPSLNAVRAFPAGEVWAVSTKFVLHRAGGIWRATLIPPAPSDFIPGSREQYLDRLWAFAPDEVWVSGYWVSVGTTMTPAFLCRAESPSLDCIAPTNGSTFGVTAMFGAGDGRVWAAVPYYRNSLDVLIALESIDWSDGRTIAPASVDGWPTGQPLGLLSMWGRSADDVWAVGSGPSQDSAPIVHFDGDHWTMIPSPALATAATEWCTLVAGGAHTVFVATSTGRIFRLDQRL